MKRITLDGVSKHFDEHFALHRLHTTFDAGSATALLGANGAGKTTLLHLLATLDAPSAGRILYDTVSWERVKKHARGQIGWVSHQPLVYPDLTGLENLHFTASMYGASTRHEDLSARLTQVGLVPGAWHKRVGAYSRGMVQRLTLARALVGDPKLLLLDEPLTGLDRQGRAEVITLFEQLRDQDKILIISSHDLLAIQKSCTHVLILRQGRITHDAPLTEDLVALYEAHS